MHARYPSTRRSRRPLPPIPEELNNPAHQPPIYRLSDDLLQTMFDLVASFVPATLKVGSRVLLPGQIRVSHVCRRWRRIALDTASLWSMLRIVHPRHLVIAQKLLGERAKDALLEIKIPDLHKFLTMNYDVFPAVQMINSSLVELLQSNLHRIHSLSIGGCGSLLVAIFGQSWHTANKLQTLAVVSCPSHCRCPPHPGDAIVYPLDAPNLDSLIVSGFSLQDLPIVDPTEIRTVCFKDRHPAVWMPSPILLLEDFSKLSNVSRIDHQLAVYDLRGLGWGPQHVPTVQLVQLRHLTTHRSTTPAMLRQFFQHLNLPNLRKLSLHRLGELHKTAEYYMALIPLLDSYPSVRHLVIDVDWTTMLLFLFHLAGPYEEIKHALLPALHSLDLRILTSGASCQLPKASKSVRAALQNTVHQRNISQHTESLTHISLAAIVRDEWVTQMENYGCTVLGIRSEKNKTLKRHTTGDVERRMGLLELGQSHSTTS